MIALTEGNLQISITGAANVRKFDDDSHGLSHCMKAVDFIIELSDRYLFIEFKDPENPNIPNQYRVAAVQTLRDSELDEDLKYKFRDTFIYEWASGRADKPVDYFVLIAIDDKPLLSRRLEVLERNLPVGLPTSTEWSRPVAHRCGVFNLEDWNARFSDYPVRRLA
jgi:hypothetical protein